MRQERRRLFPGLSLLLVFGIVVDQLGSFLRRPEPHPVGLLQFLFRLGVPFAGARKQAAPVEVFFFLRDGPVLSHVVPSV